MSGDKRWCVDSTDLSNDASLEVRYPKDLEPTVEIEYDEEKNRQIRDTIEHESAKYCY